MKRLLILLILSLLLAFPVCAETSGETNAQTEKSETAETTANSETEGKGASAFLLISAVVGAMIVSALIYRGIDKQKYL